MIRRIDYIVLTVNDIQAGCCFYNRVLGMAIVSFAGGRQTPRFGE